VLAALAVLAAVLAALRKPTRVHDPLAGAQ
jgi:hypothetical protein